MPITRKIVSTIVLAMVAVVAASLIMGRSHERSAARALADIHAAIPPLAKKGAAPPVLSATAVFVKRLATGEVLLDRESRLELPIASLTKLMTALLLVELSPPGGAIAFSAQAKAAGEPDDKRSSIAAGERVGVDGMIQLLLIASANDAAYAAAEHLGVRSDGGGAGSFAERINTFVERMNERARILGLSRTHFANPAGNDDPGNYSTARDIASLAEFIARHRPELWAASRLPEAALMTQDGHSYSIANTNPLLGEYPALAGSKTGFEDQARGTLVFLYSLAPEDSLVAVFLKSEDRFGDERKLIEWIESNFELAPA